MHKTFALALVVAICGLYNTRSVSSVTRQPLAPSQPILMEDPIFGLSYDPKEIIFEEAPRNLSRLCSGLKYEKLWLYAHWRGADSTDYFIVSGFMMHHPDGSGKPGLEPGFGAAISLHGIHCITEDPSWMLSGVAIKQQSTSGAPGEILPGFGAQRICDRMGNCHYNVRSAAEERVLRGIIVNALTRYSTAFKGKQKFLNALPTVNRAALEKASPVVSEEVKKSYNVMSIPTISQL